MTDLNFYDNGYIPADSRPAPVTGVDISNPNSIYGHLRRRLYKQDEYCKDLSLILYNHASGNPGCYFIAGPAGCGKSEGINAIRELWPNTIVVDSASLSSTGWSGDAKVRDFTKMIDPGDPKAIICFDEVDKLIMPKHNSSKENCSVMLQHEFLKLIDGCITGGKDNVDTSCMTFLFCGSFAAKANAIAKRESDSGFGFGTNANIRHAFDRDFTIQDLIEFGLIVELASRCQGITTLKPLSMEDYKYLLKSHESSPLKRLEQKSGIRLSISDELLDDIAHKAFDSGLGVRNVYAQLKRLVDNEVFESFARGEGKPDEISL